MFVCVFMYVCSCARLYFQVLVHAHGHKHTRETRKTTQSRVCNENLQVVALVSAVRAAVEVRLAVGVAEAGAEV